MAIKNLEEKIEDISFWTIVFLIMYLIVGYLIKSEWLSKVLKFSEIYEILKDGLTITAAFLAPAAAFVLFSDWRLQHREIATEANATKMLSSINKLYWNLNILNLEITSPNVLDIFDLKELKEKIDNCRLKNGELVIEFTEFCHLETSDNNFTNLCSEIINENFPDFLIKMANYYCLLQRIKYPENFRIDEEPHTSLEIYKEKHKKELKNSQLEMEKDLKIIEENLIQLSLLKENLKV
ncbi:hypothetical protein OPU61_001479 [Acinetobacter baumannii]|nr:hypothetical protein [Acinetobacter baumannii]